MDFCTWFFQDGWRNPETGNSSQLFHKRRLERLFWAYWYDTEFRIWWNTTPSYFSPSLHPETTYCWLVLLECWLNCNMDQIVLKSLPEYFARSRIFPWNPQHFQSARKLLRGNLHILSLEVTNINSCPSNLKHRLHRGAVLEKNILKLQIIQN